MIEYVFLRSAHLAKLPPSSAFVSTKELMPGDARVTKTTGHAKRHVPNPKLHGRTSSRSGMPDENGLLPCVAPPAPSPDPPPPESRARPNTFRRLNIKFHTAEKITDKIKRGTESQPAKLGLLEVVDLEHSQAESITHFAIGGMVALGELFADVRGGLATLDLSKPERQHELVVKLEVTC